MTTGPKEHRVTRQFFDTLGIEMYSVEPRKGNRDSSLGYTKILIMILVDISLSSHVALCC